MMTIFRFFLLIFILSTLLTACGQRGPLYLPDNGAPVVIPARANPPPAAPPAVQPTMSSGLMDSGFESTDKPDEDDREDDEANGL